jgi:hypothetical protein
LRLLRGEPTEILAKPLEHDLKGDNGKILERKETLTLSRRIT